MKLAANIASLILLVAIAFKVGYDYGKLAGLATPKIDFDYCSTAKPSAPAIATGKCGVADTGNGNNIVTDCAEEKP